MQLQDVVVLVYLALFNVTVYRGITRPAHNQTHLAIIALSLFTPFVSFDLAHLGAVPSEAWAFCAAFVGVQIIHTAFHYLRPQTPHADGPEILFQPLICVWGAVLRFELGPELWYRGAIGTFLYGLNTIFVSLAVLMTIYMGELTSVPDDRIDFAHDPISTRSNSGFLAGSAATLMVVLFVTFRDPLWLLGAAVSFALVRALVPPRPDAARS